MKAFLLSPAGKNYLWGGTRLKKEYNKNIDITPLAETWECSAHPEGLSVVRSGEYAGMTLESVIKMHPEYLGSKSHGDLPVIVKLIDAEQKLSVQVHPDNEYAMLHENQNGKTEMWYVLDAEPDSSIVWGFSHDVNKELLRDAVENDTLCGHLKKIPVKRGDVFFIPPGTIHALGAGVMVAEIQQCSDVTYRVYDYNRTDKDGNKRELHFNKATDVLNMNKSDFPAKSERVTYYHSGYTCETLCRCEYFSVELIKIISTFNITVNAESFRVVLCIDGSATLTDGDNYKISFIKGDCIFIPADTGTFNIYGSAEILIIKV